MLLSGACVLVLCSAGSKLAIVGPNGAGKSTLLKILGKRAQHDAGTVSRKEVRLASTRGGGLKGAGACADAWWLHGCMVVAKGSGKGVCHLYDSAVG